MINIKIFFSRNISVEYTEFQAQFAIKGATQIHFAIPAQTNTNVINFNDNVLEVGLKLTSLDGTPLNSAAMVAPQNPIIDSLFKQVSITLNNNNISRTDNDYSLKAYLSKLLSYPSSSKTSWMSTEGYYADTDRYFDESKLDHRNIGFLERMALFKDRSIPLDKVGSAAFTNDTVTLCGRIFSDLSSIDCGILPGIDVKIEMTMASDAYRLWGKGDEAKKAELTIESCCLLYTSPSPRDATLSRMPSSA